MTAKPSPKTTVKKSTPKLRPALRENPRKAGHFVNAEKLIAEIDRISTFHQTQRAHLRNIHDLSTASLHTQRIETLAELKDWVNAHKVSN